MRFQKIIICLLLALFLLAGCQKAPAVEAVEGPAINGVSLSSYAIVYSDEDTDYALRAAQYLQTEIENRTGVLLPLQEDSSVTATHDVASATPCACVGGLAIFIDSVYNNSVFLFLRSDP